ncbi:MAG: DNA mismatch repair protein MutS [Clostridia bacterium]|nr:DNA mismatch repair protein MutS [Clostridia bacterium]
MAEKNEFSPMMQEYLKTKEEYKDCILFYRLGDFYEMFFDDAIRVSKELELTLTGKLCGQEERAPMCGVPFHAADTYIARLIEKGYKVAICEQLEDPKLAKGMVKRGVIRVVTPGTVIESNLLDEKKNNYIMSIYKTGINFGVSVCDISTGDFRATQIIETNNFPKLLDEISRYTPAEIVVNPFMFDSLEEINKIKERFEVYVSRVKEEAFSTDLTKLNNYTFVDDHDQDIENLEEKNMAIASINGLLDYLTETQMTKLDHINKIIIYNITKYMALDISARRNLEITEKMRDKSKKGTLLWVLDKTSTSMGARMLRRWLNDPLIDVWEINHRLEAVKELKDNIMIRGDITDYLKKVYDIERLVGKVSYGNANGRDLVSLKNSAKQLPDIKKVLSNCKSEMLVDLYNNLDELKDIHDLIEEAIVDEPPMTIKEGNLIKIGYNAEIDTLKKATTQGKTWLVELETKEREATGIKNLKVGFNKVFGYYIEVSKSNVSMVPDRYIRKQTLTTGERYITEELKNLENQILGAEERVINLEYNAFTEVREDIEKKIKRVQKTAEVIANLDVLCSFATVAEDMGYVEPIVDNSGVIDIKDGRHPVIEKMLSAGGFVPNDTYLDKDSSRLAIITGPNMAGKSTYMRQVALITLMAQVGSFVPASSARIGIVDKIFTRVGASDDLSMGQSTFMVEMMEVATILKNATSNSLVILDEIGRGTSTYDGLSIAWAVAEYIADKEKSGAKTLFATHYHELVDLENTLEGIKNYSIAVKEKGEDIIFLRKIVNGGTDESYGVHVARLAGVPKDVTKRANEILRTLERKNIMNGKTIENKKQVAGQLDMGNYKLAELAEEIDKIDLNSLTPIDALNTLVKIKEKMS